MTQDLISDMLTRIRNASSVQHNYTHVPFSRINLNIVNVLAQDGYINSFIIEKSTGTQRWIKVFLRYKGWWIKKPTFSIIKRISTPGHRVFASYKDFRKKVDLLKYEYGIAVISTSSGIMSNLKAAKLKKGGEILCYIG